VTQAGVIFNIGQWGTSFFIPLVVIFRMSLSLASF